MHFLGDNYIYCPHGVVFERILKTDEPHYYGIERKKRGYRTRSSNFSLSIANYNFHPEKKERVVILGSGMSKPQSQNILFTR